METNTPIPNVVSQAPGVAEFSAPAAAPPAAPLPAPLSPQPAAMTPPPLSPSPSFSSGGGGGKFDPIRDINWMETLFLGFAMGALWYTIAYYRYKLKEDKLINSDTQRQIDNLNGRIGTVETNYTKLMTPAATASA